MGQFILVNTKFSAFNGAYSVEDAIAKKILKGQITNEFEASEYRDYAAFHERGFALFTKLVDALSREFPQYKIVIRPHPSEQADKWRIVTSRLPNALVAGDGNVAEWLEAADVVIHNNCTTGIECFLLGKLPISYRPVRDERFDMLLPSLVSEDASTLEEVVKLVSYQLKNGNARVLDSPDRWEIVSRHIANFVGPPACPQIMDVLDTIALRKSPFEPYLSTPFESLARIIMQKRRIRRLAKEQPGVALRKSKELESRGELVATDLENFIRTASETLDRDCNIHVVKIRGDMLCVYSEK
jgi:hypothetical protein